MLRQQKLAAMMGVVTSAAVINGVYSRTSNLKQATPEQLAKWRIERERELKTRGEREMWNAAVEAKRAAWKERKNG